ncbi:MAG: corrinoid protein [Desulfohalobiaceae bacterium]|nr:corrinoid protein [Desulfohalobiaceae bacterium]
MTEKLGKIADGLLSGNVEEVSNLTQELLDDGTDPEEILQKGLFAGMDVVSQKFKDCEMFIPEVLRSAKAMQGAMEKLRPKLSEASSSKAGTVVTATVQGDLHDIGKNLAGMMMEGSGFNVIDMGIDRKTEDIVNAVKENKPQILGLSALLTTTMPKMGEVINALKEAGIRDQVKVMIGGAPVTDDFAEEIGADAYAPNASIGTEKALELIKA